MTKKTSVLIAAAGAKAPPSVRPATSLFADAPLTERFGFLIRRLHQIHIALFMQEVGDLDITTIQFTALSVLYQLGEIDQSELAAHVGEESLSDREVEVLRHVAEGNRNRDIAKRLFIAEETVKVHLKHIMGKLGASDRTQSVAIAARRGIIYL